MLQDLSESHGLNVCHKMPWACTRTCSGISFAFCCIKLIRCLLPSRHKACSLQTWLAANHSLEDTQAEMARLRGLTDAVLNIAEPKVTFRLIQVHSWVSLPFNCTDSPQLPTPHNMLSSTLAPLAVPSWQANCWPSIDSCLMPLVESCYSLSAPPAALANP